MPLSRLALLLGTLASALALGCDEGERVEPYRAPQLRRHLDARRATERCRAALDVMLGLPLDQQFPSVFQACSALYVERPCREALRTLAEVPAKRRALRLARVCRSAYCGKLPPPEPALCSSQLEALDDASLRRQWRHFNWRVFEWDLGEGDPLDGLAFRYLEAGPAGEQAAPARLAPLPPVRITLERAEGGYAVRITGANTPTEQRHLETAFSPQDVADLLVDELALSRATPLEIECDDESNGLSRVMRGASDAGFVQLTIVR